MGVDFWFVVFGCGDEMNNIKRLLILLFIFLGSWAIMLVIGILVVELMKTLMGG